MNIEPTKAKTVIAELGLLVFSNMFPIWWYRLLIVKTERKLRFSVSVTLNKFRDLGTSDVAVNVSLSE